MHKYFGPAVIPFIYIGMLLLGIGHLFFMWMALQAGNFVMFVICFFPLTCIFSAPLGAYSMLFGAPEWLMNMMGY